MDYPTFLPGWETIERIGKGGFSIVYKIKQADEILGDVYSALKVIEIPRDKNEYRHYELEGYDDASIKTIFKAQVNNIVAESEIMFKFRGAPNIVNFESHKVVETDTGFMVLIKMELLEPLLEYNKRHPLDEVAIVKLGMSICEALKLCSEEKIVHRDIKPLNIFVDKFNNFKLGDFGIARVMDHTTRATKIGTLTYVAPEVYNGKPYNNKTDIYSLGLVLYWFLNELRLPFLPLPPAIPTPSDNESACARRLNGEKLLPPVNGCDQLKMVVLKACAVNPEDRYSSADEFYDDLEEVKTALKRKKATYTGNIDLPEDGKIATPSDEVKIATPSEDGKNMGESGEKNNPETPLPGSKVIDAPNPNHESTVPLTIDSMISANTPSRETRPSDNALNGAAQLQTAQGGKSKHAPDKVAPDFAWNISDGTLIISGHGDMPYYSEDDKKPWDSKKYNIKSVVISDGITSIGEWAFNTCYNLTSVTISKSVTFIDGKAFSGRTVLTSINVDDSNTEYTSADGILFTKDKTELITYPAGKTEKEFAIPQYVTAIGEEAFSWCKNLKSVNIPDSVTAIGNKAFYCCQNLKSLTIPFSVTSIGGKVFSGCKNLASINVDISNPEYISAGGILFNKDKTKLIAYLPCKTEKNFAIPQSVTTIEDGAFYGCENLTSVTIPHSVTTIGEEAFYSCKNLTSVTIPDSVTAIGKKAFSSCENLTSVTIPSSVANIGEEAFSCCKNLVSINVDTSNTKYSSADGILYTKDKTMLIAYPARKTEKTFSIPNSVENICTMSFYSCENLISVNIPNSVTTIEKNTFSWCKNLASVNIPDSVISIGDSAFSGCKNLTSVTIPDSVTTIGKEVFCFCENLTSVTIPNSVTTIGEEAFYYCGKLTSVTIPNSVTTIGEKAFYYCKKLTSVTIPNSVTTIGAGTFYWCDNLKSVTIPDSVTTIGEDAFSWCKNLTSITIPDSVISIGDSAFESCDNMKSLNIPKSVATIGKKAFSGCNKLTSINVDASNTEYTSVDGILFNKDKTQLIVYPAGKEGKTFTIPNSVTTIGDSAFYWSKNLTSVTIPSSVTAIGEKAFYFCYDLTSITIPSSVTTIGKEAFSSCDNLTSINVNTSNPEYISVGGIVFSKDKTKLITYPAGKKEESFTIPSHVTAIGDSAFSCCEKLTSVTIPNSVTAIGNGAFESCNHLESITIPNSVITIGNNAFYSCYDLASVTISESVTTIGVRAFESCNKLTSVTIPSSVTNIGYAAFSWCDNLKSVTISESVPTIGDYAFEWCKNLTSVTIPESVTTIGKGAFYNCKSLAEIKYAGTKEQWDYISKNDDWDKKTGNYVVLYSQSQESTSKPTQGDKGEIKYDPNIFAPDFAWNISNGTLTISGHGKMPDYSYSSKAPWDSEKEKIKSVIISKSITSIGNNAFSECENIASIDIPDSVKSIGDSAFHWCNNLTSITIPASVKTIGSKAFSCSNITSIALPKSVTYIGWGAFSNCYYLNSINVDISNTEYASANGVLLTKDKTKLIAYPARKTEKSFTIPNSVTTIGDYAFYGCQNLTLITIPNSVTTIEDSAFFYCKTLTSITIPTSVSSIGWGVFYECSSLNEIKFEGTKAKWKAISKDKDWKEGTGSFKVICKDATISKFFA